ncbi:MAG: N-acetyltransferase [Muribaculaceae bacterium]|nr:N-acetyltransferase [Muribaculaceae bacterium]
MSIIVKPINAKKSEIKKYVQFGIDLYKGNDCYVPPLVFDEVDSLLPDKNPAFDFCKAQSFMAYRDNKPVGRITAIINNIVNERTGEKTMRFGWVDFIDDNEVVDALFNAAEEWGRSQGMTTIIGPMGFSDMDHEGMLIDGFNEMGTMATIYNYPYYPTHMERMGFEKDADWVEFRITIPEAVPEKHQRIADIVRRKHNLHTVKFTSRKKLKEKYGQALFDLINEAYDKLYGFSPLTQRQIDYYINMYLGFLRLDDVSVIVDADEKLVGLGISMPSFSRALQKSGGKLFPFGWWHILKAMQGKTDTVDLMLIAISKEYLSKGVNALLFADLIPAYAKNGYQWAESNPELEDNANVQLQWQYFDYRQHRRRRAFKKSL